MKKIQKAFSLIELSIVILIIGIIVAGVTSGSTLINKMRLSSARNLTSSSPVSAVKDLAIWLESTSDKSFIDIQQQNNLNITTWRDINPQSGAKIDLVQSTPAAQPIFKTASINNLPTLYFDGVNNYLQTASGFKLSDVIQADQVTLFVVFKPLDGSLCNTPFMASLSGGNPRISFHVTCQDLVVMDFGTCCGVNDGRLIDSSLSNQVNYIGKPLIISYIVKNSTGTLKINGATFFNAGALTQVFTDSQLNEASSAFIKIGSDAKGYIGEVILFRRGLKNQEILDIEAYLAKKWGIRF